MRGNALYLLLILFLGTIVYLNGTVSAEAETDLYGAIAFSPSTRAYGFSYDHASRESAKKEAMEECKTLSGNRDCKTVIWFQNGCGALAVGDIGYGTGWGNSREWAQNYALESCASWTGNCRIVRWVCTTPQ